MEHFYNGQKISNNNVVYIRNGGFTNALYLDEATGMPINIHDFTLGHMFRAMGRIQRYNGLCKVSVLDHSLIMAKYLVEKQQFELAYWALIHDMSEVITGDLFYATKYRAGLEWKKWANEVELFVWRWATAELPQLKNKWYVLCQDGKQYDKDFCYAERCRMFGEVLPKTEYNCYVYDEILQIYASSNPSQVSWQIRKSVCDIIINNLNKEKENEVRS